MSTTPFKDEYQDFDKSPRWFERTVSAHHPNGLLVRSREFFAFVDRRKKEWDYTEHTDSLVWRRESLTTAEREEHRRKQQDVLAVWNFLARAQQGTFEIEGFLAYADILLIDPDGDSYHNYPHLYAEFTGISGPYSGFYTSLSIHKEKIDLDHSWRRIDFFPKTFSRSAVKPRSHRTKKIDVDPETLRGLLNYTDSLDRLYAADDRFDFLRQRDVIAIANSARQSGEPERLLQIRHIKRGSLLEYLRDCPDEYRIRLAAERQIGREITDEEHLTILEVERVSEWQVQDE